MSSRGLCRSRNRPAGMPATPATTSATENAPVSSAAENPSSRSMGTRKTANA